MGDLRLVGISRPPALTGVDLRIARGELVALVGRSGAGKSTLLRIVAGLVEPSAGRVLLGGKDVTAMTPSQRDVAIVLQSDRLYSHLTVYENLAFALRARRLAEPEIQRRVIDAASSLGIEDLLQVRPTHLSSGQRQRIAIGRAVAREPRVFLFDEPLSSLDAESRAEMRREIARLHREAGATSIYVTHDHAEAIELASRIVVVEGGAVHELGAPADVVEPRPALHP